VAASEVKEARASFNLGNALADVLTHLFCVSIHPCVVAITVPTDQEMNQRILNLKLTEVQLRGQLDCRARQHR
jgi:hypothetical protein